MQMVTLFKFEFRNLKSVTICIFINRKLLSGDQRHFLADHIQCLPSSSENALAHS